jgi:hypothetical protein
VAYLYVRFMKKEIHTIFGSENSWNKTTWDIETELGGYY